MSTLLSIQEEALATLLTGPDTVTHATKPRDLNRLPTAFVAVAENRVDLEALGFTVGEVIDDLFTEVTAPAGWGLVSTDHYMYSHAVDAQGRVRGQLGYKGSSHDRWASFYFLTRFEIEEVRPENWWLLHRPATLTQKVKRKVRIKDENRARHASAYDSEWVQAAGRFYPDDLDGFYGERYEPAPRYEMREVEEPLPDDQQPQPQAYAKGFGVKDRAGDAFVFETGTYQCEPMAYRDHEIAEEPLKAEALVWLDAHFPEHRSVTAYW
ncbi:hypothetical protein MARCHEWKA_02470 [Brevundimonas phage vB_BpoS-Marchewka]|uniref:Uncharacterized protein n=1 Tax=Brevundimonas phage vB_BpoS-Marchewka TaxID=2948604 RepID=A0A9E7SR50_9CAUD|nr:hypothetical protein MARCHEWKA_02470 [Brevundimonas phage vB_BpoS-Marchewka]UTC29206.1 hypothetical protein BAMBUS_01240 [Brevundimonas phage vB_BpoS-Bambus]